MTREENREHRAVLYMRLASSRERDGSAIARQRAGCVRIAEKYGLTIVREYVDQGRPARLAQQDALRRLLDDLLRRHDAAFVVVWDYARLGRDMSQLKAVTALIRLAGAEIATIIGVEAAVRYVQERSRTSED